MTLEALAYQQQQLAAALEIPSGQFGFYPKADDLIFALDVHYEDQAAYTAVSIQKWQGEHLGTVVALQQVEQDYVPGYFCFREGPLLLWLVEQVINRLQLHPALLIADGHGLAHPRKFGLACWLGVKMNLPTIGCAKEPLLKYPQRPGKHKGDQLPQLWHGEVVGSILRSQENVKPLFVSPGHLVSVENASRIILQLCDRYRQCEPLRRADQAARAYAKGKLAKHSFSITNDE
jgi:deoxyribonuclease V